MGRGDDDEDEDDYSDEYDKEKKAEREGRSEARRVQALEKEVKIPNLEKVEGLLRELLGCSVEITLQKRWFYESYGMSQDYRPPTVEEFYDVYISGSDETGAQAAPPPPPAQAPQASVSQ